MRINRVMAGAVASVLAFGAVAPAFADNDHRRGHDRREWREDRREWRQDRRDWERDRREARRAAAEGQLTEAELEAELEAEMEKI